MVGLANPYQQPSPLCYRQERVVVRICLSPHPLFLTAAPPSHQPPRNPEGPTRSKSIFVQGGKDGGYLSHIKLAQLLFSDVIILSYHPSLERPANLSGRTCRHAAPHCGIRRRNHAESYGIVRNRTESDHKSQLGRVFSHAFLPNGPRNRRNRLNSL